MYIYINIYIYIYIYMYMLSFLFDDLLSVVDAALGSDARR